MVFCNEVIDEYFNCPLSCHNPYFNRWFSAIKRIRAQDGLKTGVTILILIDGFLQFLVNMDNESKMKSQSLF